MNYSRYSNFVLQYDACVRQHQLMYGANPVFILDWISLQKLTRMALELKNRFQMVLQQLSAMSLEEQSQAQSARPEVADQSNHLRSSRHLGCSMPEGYEDVVALLESVQQMKLEEAEISLTDDDEETTETSKSLPTS